MNLKIFVCIQFGLQLSSEETTFLQENMSKQLADFEKAAGQIAGAEILSSAAGQVASSVHLVLSSLGSQLLVQVKAAES